MSIFYLPLEMSVPFVRYVRRIHMYFALFLTPWVLMYAISAFIFNHFETIRDWYGGDLNRFERIEEVEYKDAFEESILPADAAKQILVDLDLDGAHFIRGSLKGELFTIIRQSSYATRRVLYYPQEGRIVVEKQVANLPSILTRMHTRHGFGQKYVSAKAWGLGVEITALAMLFWIASGLWLCWSMKSTRKSGGLFLLGGFALFSVLLFSI